MSSLHFTDVASNKRTFNSECVAIHQPEDVIQSKEVVDDQRFTYNHHRPPYVAFPTLPTLPALPDVVDPEHWLLGYHQRLFKRRVTSSGRIQIDKHRYYIRRDLAGNYTSVS